MPTPRLQLGRLRARAGFTQESLAARLGVSRTTVARWEQGVGGLPYPRIRAALAETLEVAAEELEACFAADRDNDLSGQRPVQLDERVGSLWKLHEALKPSTANPELLAALSYDIVLMDHGSKRQGRRLGKHPTANCEPGSWVIKA